MERNLALEHKQWRRLSEMKRRRSMRTIVYIPLFSHLLCSIQIVGRQNNIHNIFLMKYGIPNANDIANEQIINYIECLIRIHRLLNFE